MAMSMSVVQALPRRLAMSASTRRAVRRSVSWPGRHCTEQLVLRAAWLMLVYMCLLATVEVVELLRRRMGAAAAPPTKVAQNDVGVCPFCSKSLDSP